MKKTFFPQSVNSVGYTLRQPYKIALCALVNAVLLVFCFMEGGQWLLANSAIAEAMENRVYIGYLEALTYSEGGEDAQIVWAENGLTVSEEALAYLENSPYVRDTHPIRAHSAKLGSTVWMPSDEADANTVFLFVGRVRGEPMNKNVLVGRSGSEERETINEYRRTIYPLCVTAGHKKHLAIPPTEKSGLPILVIRDVAHYLPDPETGEYTTEIIRQPDPGLNDGERCLFVAKTSNAVVGEGSAFELHDYAGIAASTENRYDRMIYREQPGDEALSDEEFGEKAVRALGLEEYAAVLDRAEFLVTVQETDATDTMVLRQREALRIMTGRELTKKDAGKNVCLMFVSDAADQGLRVGSTVRLALYRRNVAATVPQANLLFDGRTVLENVLYPMLLKGTDRGAAEERARGYLADVKLPEELYDRFPGECSGGEQKRAAFARAMALDNPVVLADEPTANLDKGTSAIVSEILRLLAAERGKLVLAVTHEEAIPAVADERLFLRAGVIEKD